MAEFIKHALGLCGEHFHPNLWTLLIGGACILIYKHIGFSTIFSYVRSYIKCKFNQAFAYTQNTWQKLNK